MKKVIKFPQLNTAIKCSSIYLADIVIGEFKCPIRISRAQRT